MKSTKVEKRHVFLILIGAEDWQRGRWHSNVGESCRIGWRRYCDSSGKWQGGWQHCHTKGSWRKQK